MNEWKNVSDKFKIQVSHIIYLSLVQFFELVS
jgi:hypothetical protein